MARHSRSAGPDWLPGAALPVLSSLACGDMRSQLTSCHPRLITATVGMRLIRGVQMQNLPNMLTVFFVDQPWSALVTVSCPWDAKLALTHQVYPSGVHQRQRPLLIYRLSRRVVRLRHANDAGRRTALRI